MSVRCTQCAAEAANLPALAAHVRATHGRARATTGATSPAATAPASAYAAADGEIRSVMADGREGSVARDTGRGYEDTGEREACEVCGRLDVLRPVARSTWSLDPERRTALVCPPCAGAAHATP